MIKSLLSHFSRRPVDSCLPPSLLPRIAKVQVVGSRCIVTMTITEVINESDLEQIEGLFRGLSRSTARDYIVDVLNVQSIDVRCQSRFADHLMLLAGARGYVMLANLSPALQEMLVFADNKHVRSIRGDVFAAVESLDRLRRAA